MKLQIQKAITAIPLSEYAEEYKNAGDPHLHVWVNIPRELLQKRDELDGEYFRLMAENDILRAEFREKLKELDEQQTEGKRKPNATQKERTRVASEYKEKQDALQTEIEAYTRRNYAWFVELWSQGPEDTRWTVDELLELQEHDHLLVGWMADQTRLLLQTRRVDQKKT